MTEDRILTRILPLLRKTFPKTKHQFSPTTRAEDVAGWDSMTHVGLMADIEEEFGVRFEQEEFSGFENLGQLVELVARKIDGG